MQAIIMVLMIPLIALNMLGGIGSGIWLAILGEWWAIGYGLLGIFGSAFVLSFVLMPGVAFAGPAAMLAERGKTILALPFLFLSGLYTYAVVTVWCVLVFYFFMRHANHTNLWPLLIWSFGVATAPWSYMASKEAQGGSGAGSAFATFFCQVAYVAMCLVFVFRQSTVIELGIVFASVMGIGLLITTTVGLAALRERSSPFV